MDTAMIVTNYLLGLLLGLLGYLFFKLMDRYRYWEKRGACQPSPLKVMLDNVEKLRRHRTQGEYLRDLYKAYPEAKLVGYYELSRPCLLVRDPVLLEQMLVKDFHNYTDHDIFPVDEKVNPLEISLFSMNGNKWRSLRYKLLPTFTTSKLKGMVDLIRQNASEAVLNLGQSKRGVTLYETLFLYTTGVVASCIFGLEPKNLTNPNSDFHRHARQFFTLDTWQFFKFQLMRASPWLAKFFKLSLMKQESLDFFSGVIKGIFRNRKETGVYRNDFVQLLMELRDKGSIDFHPKELDQEEDDMYLKSDEIFTTETYEITEDLILSQAILFIATEDTMSYSIQYALLELARNPEVQDRLREEVVREKEHAGGKLTYQALKNMTYLDMCINESSRLYPASQFLVRSVTRPCTLDNVPLEVGTQITVPLMGLHHDPEYHPEPEHFNPERSHPPYTSLTFGAGPRICIGMRFTLLLMKMCLATLIDEYELRLNPLTRLPLEFDIQSLPLKPKHMPLFDIKKIK